MVALQSRAGLSSTRPNRLCAVLAKFPQMKFPQIRKKINYDGKCLMFFNYGKFAENCPQNEDLREGPPTLPQTKKNKLIFSAIFYLESQPFTMHQGVLN